jgi:hypothetical protein
MPDTIIIDASPRPLDEHDHVPAAPTAAPFATIVTVEGRLIRLARDGAGLTLEIETGRGRYVAALDRFQAGAFRAAVSEG